MFPLSLHPHSVIPAKAGISASVSVTTSWFDKLTMRSTEGLSEDLILSLSKDGARANRSRDSRFRRNDTVGVDEWGTAP
jgi:hypothetical protein